MVVNQKLVKQIGIGAGILCTAHRREAVGFQRSRHFPKPPIRQR